MLVRAPGVSRAAPPPSRSRAGMRPPALAGRDPAARRRALLRSAAPLAGCLALLVAVLGSTCGIGIPPDVRLAGRRAGMPRALGRGRSRTGTAAVRQCESEAFYDEAISSTSRVTVVAFSTTWCAPCKLMDPKLDELSESYDAVFIKVNGDKTENDGRRIMKREGIRSVPFYQIYKGGEKLGHVIGAKAEELEQAIIQHTVKEAKMVG